MSTRRAPRRLVSSSRGRAVLRIRSWEAITCPGMKKRRASQLRSIAAQSAHHKSGHLSKLSLTTTQALLYFDSFAPGEVVTLKYRLRAKYPIRARTFKSQVYEYYDPEIASVARPVQLEVRKR